MVTKIYNVKYQATLLYSGNENRINIIQKQPSRDVLRKRYTENMEQIYMRTPMLKCDFNKVDGGYF